MATTTQEINTLRRRAFALAKTAGFERDDAESFLRGTAQVESLKTLDLDGWRNLVAWLAKRTPTEVMTAPANCTKAQWGKLMVLKRQLKWSDATFRREIHRIAKVQHECWLDVPRARSVIAAMENILKAQEAKAAKARANPSRDRQRPKPVKPEVRS